MNTISESAYEGDIVRRLHNWRGLHLAHGGELFEAAAAEIERLRGYRDNAESDAAIARVLVDRYRMTDEEREAVGWVLGNLRLTVGVDRITTLRDLLKRLGGEKQ